VDLASKASDGSMMCGAGKLAEATGQPVEVPVLDPREVGEHSFLCVCVEGGGCRYIS
jgi:hypothetical protein